MVVAQHGHGQLAAPKTAKRAALKTTPPAVPQGNRLDAMKRRVPLILFAVIVLGWLVLFFGPLVRGLTMGAIVAGVLWFGLIVPNRRGRR